ncbi:MAG TPA: hypothetical protein VEF76_02320 [Patescibacteria group bacterium]|nr:hypothetical protein [Patescibacteria group bacterium]
MTSKRTKLFATIAATSALTLAFLAASVRPMRAQNPAVVAPIEQTQPQTSHSYWKHPDYDAIIDLWTDTSGIHFRVHALNPENPKVRELVAGNVSKDKKDLTTADFEKTLNYAAQLRDMKNMGNGRWQGKIWIEQRKEAFGFDIQLPQQGEKNLKLRGYAISGWKKVVTLGGIVGKSLELSPVANPPPRGLSTAPKATVDTADYPLPKR